MTQTNKKSCGAGKGSARIPPKSWATYRENHDYIFKKKPLKNLKKGG